MSGSDGQPVALDFDIRTLFAEPLLRMSKSRATEKMNACGADLTFA
jgi:hypothetical protein